VESAIRDARLNAKHNGIENAEFAAEDAGAYLQRMAAEGANLDVLMMDPPRAGSSEEFLQAALTLAPERIVYISCNPATQARDVRILEQGGYHLQRIQPVDMFPHTDHVETVVLMSRKDT
jgi:23S rRNA (uracil1939-C5)-methyltransferase